MCFTLVACGWFSLSIFFYVLAAVSVCECVCVYDKEQRHECEPCDVRSVDGSCDTQGSNSKQLIVPEVLEIHCCFTALSLKDLLYPPFFVPPAASLVANPSNAH